MNATSAISSFLPPQPSESSATLARGGRPTLRQAAGEVESMFLSLLLKEMRQSLGEEDGLFSGDTGDTEQLWEVAARLPRLSAAFIETSFPDDMLDLARVSKHLTPALMAKQLKKLGRPDVPVYVYHMKPKFESRIREELQRLDFPCLSILEEGQELVLI